MLLQKWCLLCSDLWYLALLKEVSSFDIMLELFRNKIMWPGGNRELQCFFIWFAFMSGFLSRLLFKVCVGRRQQLKKNDNGMQAVLVPQWLGWMPESSFLIDKWWLNQKAFRSTFSHAPSFWRNYVPWVPKNGEEAAGHTKHLSPLFPCTPCALWTLVLHVLFHRWEWAIALGRFRRGLGKSFENLYP